MQKVAIVTDTTVDLPHEMAEELAIEMAPVHVIIDGKDYRDKIDLTGAEFYRMLPHLNPLPTTTGVMVDDWLEAFEKALQKAESIICLTLPPELSVTYSSAQAARQAMPEADITIIDTRTATAGEALIAIAAGRAAKEGKSKEEVIALVNELIPKVDTLLTCDTIEYLRRGGRLNAPQALIANFLNLRPIIRLRDGALTPVRRTRSRRVSLNAILDLMAQEIGEGEICAAILHALVHDEAEAFKAEIENRFRCREVIILDDLGPVAGTHLGPGAIGVGYYVVSE
ncbi:MAG: hypothetical protein DRI61_00440 [Chloroflexi bacterium]|nr:MAG: hypothetical protein DRI61_00440 [Chloroflexota bacterium]HDN79588.1 DegV family protein [Chloroflexota bacterium]